MREGIMLLTLAVLWPGIMPDPNPTCVRRSHLTAARAVGLCAAAQLCVLEDDTDAVKCLTWTTDDSLAAGYFDGCVRLWCIDRGADEAPATRTAAPITSLAYSADGQWLLCGTMDRSVSVWDPVRRRHRARLTGHTGVVLSVACGPAESGLVASGSADSTARLWSLARSGAAGCSLGSDSGGVEANLLHVMTGHDDFVNGVALSATGEWLATASDDHTVRVWHTSSGVEGQVLRGHTSYVTCVAFSGLSAAGELLASGACDNAVILWLAPCSSTGTELQRCVLASHSETVNAVAFDATASLLASASDDMTVCVWAVAERQLAQTLKGHTAIVNSVSFSGNGALIASGSDDRTVRVWGATTGDQLWAMRGHNHDVRAVCFSPVSPVMVASGSYDRSLRLWDPSTGQQVASFDGRSRTVTSLSLMGCLEDGMVAVGSSDGTAKLWRMQGGGSLLHCLEGQRSRVTDVHLSTNGSKLASTSEDGTIWVWDAAAGVKLLELSAGAAVSSVAFVLGDSRIAAGSEDGVVRLWSTGDGSLVEELAGHGGAVLCLAISRDGQWLASGSGGDNSLRVWNLATGQQEQVMLGHENAVCGAAFSPSHLELATVSDDGSLRIWNTGKGQCVIKAVMGSALPLKAVVFSPDGKLLACGGADAVVFLVDAKSCKSVAELLGHAASVSCVAFTEDGASVCSGSHDKSVRVWRVSAALTARQLRHVLPA